MPRQLLACHVNESRPDKIIKQDGGVMPECRDLQSGVIGYYEWIQVPSSKDLNTVNDQLQTVTVGLLSVVVVLGIVAVYLVFVAQLQRRGA